jgi:Fe2+ or Zn2+ uptake regulation protein
MQPQEARVTEVVDAILRHLHDHPDAADTVDGIAKWWIPGEWCADTRTVLDALTRLHDQGLVQQRTHADGHVLYSR